MFDVLTDLLTVLDSTMRLSTPLLLACLAGLFSNGLEFSISGLRAKCWPRPSFLRPLPMSREMFGWGWPRDWGVDAIIPAPRCGVDHVPRQSTDLGCCDQLSCGGDDRIDRQSWFKQGGRTPALLSGGRFENITLPFADALSVVPIIGPFIKRWSRATQS